MSKQLNVSNLIPAILILLTLTACVPPSENGNSNSENVSSGSGIGTGTATLSWLPPTQNTDGSQLTDLAGYKIFYGTSSDYLPNEITIDNPGISTFVVENLEGGHTFYFMITAYSSNGSLGEFSKIGKKWIPS